MQMPYSLTAILAAVVDNVPAPKGDINAPLKALIFDSYYDSYLGVVVNVRIPTLTGVGGISLLGAGGGGDYRCIFVGVYCAEPIVVIIRITQILCRGGGVSQIRGGKRRSACRGR